MKYEIRELSIGGILDQAIKVLKDNLGVLLVIVCLLQLPLQAFYVIAMSPYQIDLNNLEAARTPDANYFMFTGVYFVLSLLVIPLTNAATVYAIADAYLGKQPAVGESFSRAFGRIGPLIWTWILYGLSVAGGFILFIIPGILCLIWFALATQVVVLEPHSGGSALSRSKALMKGNAGKWFVLMILVAVISGGIGAVTQFAGLMTNNMTVAQLINLVVQLLISLVAYAIWVVFYFSARCAHENFDLELLAASFGESPAEGTADGDPAGAGDEQF